MSLSLQYAHITVNDPEVALTFYRDGLGLEVTKDVSYEGDRWITLGFGDGAAQLVLSNPHAGRSPADGDALQELVTKGALDGVAFRAADLTATFDRAVAAGADVVQEPMEQFWGERDCALRDPSGNLVRISQA